MGTRSMTHVIDVHGDMYVSMYRQYDGYPEGGHGQELAEFLDGAVIGNGISMGEKRPNFFNGVGDLACRLVSYFKSGGDLYGGFYLMPPSRDNDQEFTYVVTCDSGYDREGGVNVEVIYWGKQIFKGTSAEFLIWIPVSDEAMEDA